MVIARTRRKNDVWHLNFTPWTVQEEALRCMEGHDKFGLWMEMGLGKSAVTLNDFVEHDEVDLCIVVAPQSFKNDWPAFVVNYGLGFLQTGYWPKNPLPFDWEQGVYALNYEAISRSKAKDQLIKLFDQRRVMLVLDESKALGNPSSGWTKSAIELAKRAKLVRLLNGTPTTQSPIDLYGQLRALGEIQGWTAVEFRNRFCVLGGFMGKAVISEIKNGEELARIMDRCSFRALKMDWQHSLPPKLYSTVHLEMTDLQRSHYQTMMEEFYSVVENEDIVVAEMVITQLGKLRQISSGILLDGDKEHIFQDSKTNPKLNATIELISNNSGKTIVAYFHKLSGKILIEAFQRAGFNPAWIRGGMESDDVIKQKDKFNNDSSCRVIVGQERATALGHTLLGQPGRDRCNQTVFYENSYSLYYRMQLEDRQHRGIQDVPVTYYDLVSSPVEQAVIDALVKKQEMVKSLDTIVAAVRSYREMVTRVASRPVRAGHTARTD